MTVEEMWKDVVGFENYYEVSNIGKVWSKRYGIFLTPDNTKGYLRVRFTVHKVVTRKMISELVAEAFIGPRPIGHDVNHENGNKLDNSYTNLNYLTRQENIQHSFKLGLSKIATGEDSPHAKLLNKEVVEAKLLLSLGVSPRELGKRYSCSYTNFYHMKRKDTWKEIN